jgi:hypothetical protein
MIAYGVLVSDVCFTSWRPRAGFTALSLVVPVPGERHARMRARSTSRAGAASTSPPASITSSSGRVFFAVVMGLVMAVGWRFFDRKVDAPLVDADKTAASPPLARLERTTRSRRLRQLGGMAALRIGGTCVERCRQT